MQPKFHNVNTNPKLKLQCNVGTKCSPVKFGTTLTFRQNIYTYLYGVLAGATKMNIKCEEILNWGSVLSVFGAVSRMVPESAHEAFMVSCVGCDRVCHYIGCDLSIYHDILLC